MKSIFLLLFSLSSVSGFSQTAPGVSVRDSTRAVQVVEVACGTCKFDMPGSDCLLATRIGKNAYFVEGTSIDEHGDAHGADGFCKSVRSAEVQGNLINDKFKVTYFKLLPKK